MIKPIVHIGFPKTATKWFQHNFYSKVPDVYSVPRPQIFSSIAFSNIFSFSAQQVREQIVDQAQGRKIVLCDEILVGGLDIGFGNGEFVLLMLQRVKELFEQANIVIFIRNQHTALESAYSHYISSGGTYSAKRYLGIKPSFSKPFMGHHLFNPSIFEYDRIVSLYEESFGNQNVHVFLYEDFEEDSQGFIERFCDRFNLILPENLSFERINPRYSTLALQKQRFLNRFTLGNTPFKQYFINIPFLYPMSRELTHGIDRNFKLPRFRFNSRLHKWIDERYKETNSKLEKWVSRERLIRWGYITG